MTLVPKRDYVILLLGDVVIFAASLWLALALRYFEVPTLAFVNLHVPPFAILFAVWVGIFFLAGLYGRYTRLFRSKLLPTILYTQVINILLAALFFFFIPFFDIAPKTVLLIYLLVSSAFIVAWRVSVYPRLRGGKKLKGVLIAAEPMRVRLPTRFALTCAIHSHSSMSSTPQKLPRTKSSSMRAVLRKKTTSHSSSST